MVNFASFQELSICVCDLLFSYINIIIAGVSTKCSRLKVLEIEGMIIIRFVVLKKCKNKFDQKYFV